MKTNDKKELHSQSLADLKLKLAEITKLFDQAVSENAAGKLKNTSSLRVLKKDLAVVNTIIREKTLLAEIESK